ncbi:MAG: SDR family oxidoreductase [Planctomycetes bacterium]|nr:SDR family oxidoreductase [Planctomycetota bacterium]
MSQNLQPKVQTAGLRGSHVLVTGAGTGIGRAIAERLAREGAVLSLLARDAARLEGVADSQGAPKPFVAACDIRDRAATARAVEQACRVHGPLYAAVANSGIGGSNEPGEGDRFDDLVATNLTGTYNTLRAAQAHLMPAKNGRRHLLATASILARIGVAGYTGYCASKAGITGLVRALAAELAGEGVQVNAIAPGWVNTDMAWEGIDGIAKGTGSTQKEAYQMAMSDVPLGCMGEPEQVAGLVAYLLGPDALGTTGQCIDMNGGAFMH